MKIRFSFIIGALVIGSGVARGQQQGGAAGGGDNCQMLMPKLDKCKPAQEKLADLEAKPDPKAGEEEPKERIEFPVSGPIVVTKKQISDARQKLQQECVDTKTKIDAIQAEESRVHNEQESVLYGKTQPANTAGQNALTAAQNAAAGVSGKGKYKAGPLQQAAQRCFDEVKRADIAFNSCMSTAQGGLSALHPKQKEAQACAMAAQQMKDENFKNPYNSLFNSADQEIKKLIGAPEDQKFFTGLKEKCEKDLPDVAAMNGSCQTIANQANTILERDAPPEEQKQAKEDGKGKGEEKGEEKKPDQSQAKKDDNKPGGEDPNKKTKEALAGTCPDGKERVGGSCPPEKACQADEVPDTASPTGCKKTGIAIKNESPNDCKPGVPGLVYYVQGVPQSCDKNGQATNANTGVAPGDPRFEAKSTDDSNAQKLTSGESSQNLTDDAADQTNGPSNPRNLAGDGGKKSSYSSSGRGLTGSLFGGGGGLSGGGAKGTAVEGIVKNENFFANAGSQEKCKQAKYKNTPGCRRQRRLLEDARSTGKQLKIQPASLDLKNIDQ